MFIAFLILFSSMFHVSEFISTNLGMHPAFITEFATAANVRFGTIISSFFFKFKDFIASYIATVPFDTLKA